MAGAAKPKPSSPSCVCREMIYYSLQVDLLTTCRCVHFSGLREGFLSVAFLHFHLKLFVLLTHIVIYDLVLKGAHIEGRAV